MSLIVNAIKRPKTNFFFFVFLFIDSNSFENIQHLFYSFQFLLTMSIFHHFCIPLGQEQAAKKR